MCDRICVRENIVRYVVSHFLYVSVVVFACMYVCESLKAYMIEGNSYCDIKWKARRNLFFVRRLDGFWSQQIYV